MKISKRFIENEFNNAESKFEFCWNVLCDLKENNVNGNSIGDRFILFQDKLASTIFGLQAIRTTIVKNIKEYSRNRIGYNEIWLRRTVHKLEVYKDGIDLLVNIAKALGDAYAYFLYQSDLELLSEHLSHQRIANYSAGVGEKGELEFLKKVKHIEGKFILFHGITNILRYGDYSFIDLSTMKVDKIGELKTSQAESESLKLNLTILKRNERKIDFSAIPKAKHLKSSNGKQITRQILEIIKFLNTSHTKSEFSSTINNKIYSEEIELLISTSSVNRSNTIQASKGLAFLCFRFKKSKLFQRLLGDALRTNKGNLADSLTIAAKKLLLSNSHYNSFVISQLLYSPDLTDNSTPGTVPIFWLPINTATLKNLYFLNSIVFSIFNPAHLIHEIEDLGFEVEGFSKSTKGNPNHSVRKVVQRFELFISYIINYLMCENFVVESVKQIEKLPASDVNTRISIRPQQVVRIKPPSR